MARIGRLAGAILAETEGRYYLIGNLKEPCDFARAGFEPPGDIDALSVPYRPLVKTVGSGQRAVGSHADKHSADARPTAECLLRLVMDLEGEELARRLATCFVIKRNGSVSERLWRLVAESSDAADENVVNARWLGEMPVAIWQIVQDAVLRCD